MDASKMSVDQLKQLQRDLYKRAGDDGTLRLLCLVACELGEAVSAKYGPKYMWASGEVDIYRDEYGGYTTVYYQGKLVCSTHTTQELFVPGPWVGQVKDWAVLAIKTQESKAAERNERQRQELLERLGLARYDLPTGPVLEEESADGQ